MSTSATIFRAQIVRNWRRILIIWGVVLLLAVIMLSLVWQAFFVYVPPKKHLVIISKDGKPLPPGHVLAADGEKGIQKRVWGEGFHFVMPIIKEVVVKDNTVIPPGKVGVVTARGGDPLPAGQVLADDGQQGIWRRVLTPGTYRINTFGFDVEVVDAVEIKPGFVGVLRRLLGNDTEKSDAGAPADGNVQLVELDSDRRGVVRQVLHPGMYALNPKQYEVRQQEVGVYQTTFHFSPNSSKNTAINFVSKGGFEISMDCTVEWEVLPEDMPLLMAKYGGRDRIEETVIEAQAHAIGRDRGVDYSVQDFLEGEARTKYQEDFTTELTTICKAKGIQIRSAFIRDIVIPETYLKPLREKQVAVETEITNKAKQATAESDALVEQAQQMVKQAVAKVEAETARMVAGIERDVQNLSSLNKANVERLEADYAAKIAAIDTQRIEIEGGAAASVTKMKETARASIYQMKMEVFQNDADAFLRYTLSQQLNPKLVVRLFQSGPGTFWTNLDGGKGLNFMLPVGSNASGATTQPSGGTSPAKNR